LLGIMLTIGLAGCGNSGASAQENVQTATTESVAVNETATEETSSAEETNVEPVEKKIIVAATGAQTKPFTYIDDEGNLTGHNIDLLNAIFAELPQYELQYEITEVPSIFGGLDSDKFDIGVNNFVANEERKEKYLFSDPFLESEELIIAYKDLDISNVKQLEDLHGFTYVGGAGINHTTVVEKFNDSNPDNAIEINYSDASVDVQFTEVQDGKYDFTLADKAMYYGYYLPVFGLDVQVKTFEPSEKVQVYFLFKQGDEQLVEDVNAAYRKLVEDGTAAEISKKYYGEDLSPVK